MGINLNIDVNSEDEFNQQMQIYLAQGYSIQSNYNGTAILKKKSYSVGVLVVLIIFFFPAAIIYYLLSSDDLVTIKNSNVQSSTHTSNASQSSEEYVAYCEDCGHGLFRESKFCPGCGKDLAMNGIIPEVEKCPNCGTELMDGAKFCPQCGEDLSVEEKPNICTNCGVELMEEAKFCPNCGKDLNAEEEVLTDAPAEEEAVEEEVKEEEDGVL